MTRARLSLSSVLFAVSAVLIGAAWWLLERSDCAGDLKQGFGDIEAALAFEGQAFIAYLVGALLLIFGVSVARPFSSKWAQLGAWVAFFPLVSLSFLALVFSKGDAPWLCAL